MQQRLELVEGEVFAYEVEDGKVNYEQSGFYEYAAIDNKNNILHLGSGTSKTIQGDDISHISFIQSLDFHSFHKIVCVDTNKQIEFF